MTLEARKNLIELKRVRNGISNKLTPFSKYQESFKNSNLKQTTKPRIITSLKRIFF